MGLHFLPCLSTIYFKDGFFTIFYVIIVVRIFKLIFFYKQTRLKFNMTDYAKNKKDL